MKRLILLAVLVFGTIAANAQLLPASATYVPARPAINATIQPAGWYPYGPVYPRRYYARRVWIARPHELCVRGYRGYCRW
ncbi:MAG: hypothetical protein ABSD20_21295 [Terriglobales bacterium]|jgi:hypothetical protein